MRTLGALAGVAAHPSITAADLELLRTPSVVLHVLHASAALVLLLVATVLAVYKPAGMTAYGQRKERGETLQ